jgi:hypothetical protein
MDAEWTRDTVRAAKAKVAVPVPSHRYAKYIPWTVKVEHNPRYEIRMLRAYARQQEQGDLKPAPLRRLNQWLAEMDANNWVVSYDRDDEYGFYYTDAPAGKTAAEVGYVLA